MLPILVALFILAWNGLKSFRPKEYVTCRNYYDGFIWHVLKARTKQGFDLIKDMKDLVRGTIYVRQENLIGAYEFFK